MQCTLPNFHEEKKIMGEGEWSGGVLLFPPSIAFLGNFFGKGPFLCPIVDGGGCNNIYLNLRVHILIWCLLIYISFSSTYPVIFCTVMTTFRIFFLNCRMPKVTHCQKAQNQKLTNAQITQINKTLQKT